MDKKPRSKFFKITDTPWMSVKYGTLDKDNPDIIFIRARTRVMSDHTKQTYYKEVRAIKSAFGRSVSQVLSAYTAMFSENFLAELELSEIGLAANKSSVLKYDIYLKPRVKSDLKQFEEQIREISKIINNVIKISLDKCHIELVNK